MPEGRRRTSVQILQDSSRSPIETSPLDYDSTIARKTALLLLLLLKIKQLGRSRSHLLKIAWSVDVAEVRKPLDGL